MLLHVLLPQQDLYKCWYSQFSFEKQLLAAWSIVTIHAVLQKKLTMVLSYDMKYLQTNLPFSPNIVTNKIPLGVLSNCSHLCMSNNKMKHYRMLLCDLTSITIVQLVFIVS